MPGKDTSTWHGRAYFKGLGFRVVNHVPTQLLSPNHSKRTVYSVHECRLSAGSVCALHPDPEKPQQPETKVKNFKSKSFQALNEDVVLLAASRHILKA